MTYETVKEIQKGRKPQDFSPKFIHDFDIEWEKVRKSIRRSMGYDRMEKRREKTAN